MAEQNVKLDDFSDLVAYALDRAAFMLFETYLRQEILVENLQEKETLKPKTLKAMNEKVLEMMRNYTMGIFT